MSPRRSSLIEREREALAAHRATLRGSELPGLGAVTAAAKGTFVHGFLLPFSLIAATLRHRGLRRPYLRLAFVRGAVVAAMALVVLASGKPLTKGDASRGRPAVIVQQDEVAIQAKPPTKPAKPLRVDVPGVHIDIDAERGKEEIVVLGKTIPATRTGHRDRSPDNDAVVTGGAGNAAPAPGLALRAAGSIASGWAWILAFIAVLSVLEAIVIFFSRRYDDALSFQISGLAAIRPEDEAPPVPKLAVDIKWLYRKLKRRIRGYLVFGAGLPALVLLHVIPTIGPFVFSGAVTLWAWYWLGVFTAAKSAHAWADPETARPPAPLRLLASRVTQGRWRAPFRLYARAWSWITDSVNPAATTFERTPASFLGLALARAILALPGLYLLARPIVPVAAGRLCAEGHPAGRFSLVRCAAPAIATTGATAAPLAPAPAPVLMPEAATTAPAAA